MPIDKDLKNESLFINSPRVKDDSNDNEKSITRELIDELISIHSITNKIHISQDINEVLNISFNSALKTLQAKRGYILLTNRKNNHLTLTDISGKYSWSEITDIGMPGEWDEAKWVIMNREPLILKNGSDILTGEPRDKNTKESLAILIPIVLDDYIYGVIAITDFKESAIDSNIKHRLLEILTDQIAIAIRNTELYTTLKEQVNHFNIISNYSKQFIGMIDIKHVIHSFIDTVRDFFKVDFIGVLNTQKKFYPLICWSPNPVEKKEQDHIISSLSNIIKKDYDKSISKSRIKWETAESVDSKGGYQDYSKLLYTQVLPLETDDYKFGYIIVKWPDSFKTIKEQLRLLKGIISQTKIALTNAQLFSEMNENYIRTIKALAIAVDAKDSYTHGHSEMVMHYSEILARYIGISESKIETIKNGGLLHDIGKIGMPGYILNKPSALTDDEFNNVMKQHPVLGANIINDVPFLQDLKPMILHHHENHDGSGYPDGLKGNEITLEAQIVHIADAYEAMTSDRPYRKGLGAKEAIRRLVESKGLQFEPNLVDKFIKAMIDAEEFKEEDIN